MAFLGESRNATEDVPYGSWSAKKSSRPARQIQARLSAGVGPGLTNTRKRMRLKAKLILTATTAGLTVSIESMLGYFL